MEIIAYYLEFTWIGLAVEHGFEPWSKDPKSSVLPLHYSTSSLTAEGRDRTDMEVASQRFLRPSRLPIPPLRLDTNCLVLVTNYLVLFTSYLVLVTKVVPRARIGLATHRFSVYCSTD